MDYLQYIVDEKISETNEAVLNLVINGLPSIPSKSKYIRIFSSVLNLVINGLPSIL